MQSSKLYNADRLKNLKLTVDGPIPTPIKGEKIKAGKISRGFKGEVKVAPNQSDPAVRKLDFSEC